jgi:hypothetical protein
MYVIPSSALTGTSPAGGYRAGTQKPSLESSQAEPTRGMAGERELVRRRKDTQPPRIRIFDEHRLGETKVGRNTLPILLRQLVAPKKHAEQVAAGASFAEEDLKNVKAGHGDLLVRSRPPESAPDT